jgi:hypothetical protein
MPDTSVIVAGSSTGEVNVLCAVLQTMSNVLITGALEHTDRKTLRETYIHYCNRMGI